MDSHVMSRNPRDQVNSLPLLPERGPTRSITGLTLGIGFTLTALFAQAQTGDFIPERFGDQHQELQRLPEQTFERPKKKPGFTLPPPSAPPSSDKQLSSQLKIHVKKIKLTGNTLFSDQELGKIVRDYQDRVLTLTELEALRKALTRHYVQAGYYNSGAVIPDQKVQDGVLEINIIEGRLTEIRVEGHQRLRENYIKDRLWLGSREALNINTLQQRLLLLQQDRLISRVDAQLVPGPRRGEGLLNLKVHRTRPYELGVSFNNQRSTSIGELRGEIYGAIHNLTGFGDTLTARYGITDGLDDVSTSYSFPLTARGTRLSLHYSRADSIVVEAPFDQIDIESETEGLGITLSHPFYRTLRSQFIASATLERRRSETFLLGQPFSYSPGPDNGESNVTALRLVQDWVTRSPQQVIALRSSFNIGLDLLGATDHAGDEPDGGFFSWLGQVQYVRRLWESDNQMILRGNIQLSNDPLLPLENFAVGGQGTVRGYRENLLVRDNGAAASLEFRVPIFRLPLPYISESERDGMVQLAPFFDFGWSDNTKRPSAEFSTIASAGIGLRWDPHRKIHSQLYWGHAFRDIKNTGEDGLQDNGVHFRLDIQLF